MTVEERVSDPDLAAIPDLVDHESPASPPLALPVHQAFPRRSGTCAVPDLVGLDALDAHAIARAAELRLSVSVWETTIGPWGQVLDQQPPPGTQARRGASVRIVVSGRPYLPLPDVSGLPLDAAIEQLCWLGFVPIAGSRAVSRTVPSGHIISTRPVAGALAAHGSVVALTIARGEREAPTRSSQRRAEDR